MMMFKLLLLTVLGAYAYIPDGKDNFFSPLLLREIVNHMGKELPNLPSYIDFTENHDNNNRLPSLGVRSLNHRTDDEDIDDNNGNNDDDEDGDEAEEVVEEQLFPFDYDSLGDTRNLHPSIRDQEYLQHSSLYGSQFMSGGAGEGKQHLRPTGTMKNRQEIKTDATLPAYCNPPNPCPVGYSAEQGCIEEFENTASYSRRYQAAQDCMCDTEHMFDCPNPNESIIDESLDSFNDIDFNGFLQHTMQMNPSLQHKNLVAKKYHQYDRKSMLSNPFLTGERLPVAAKKGNNVIF